MSRWIDRDDRNDRRVRDRPTGGRTPVDDAGIRLQERIWPDEQVTRAGTDNGDVDRYCSRIVGYAATTGCNPALRGNVSGLDVEAAVCKSRQWNAKGARIQDPARLREGCTSSRNLSCQVLS